VLFTITISSFIGFNVLKEKPQPMPPELSIPLEWERSSEQEAAKSEQRVSPGVRSFIQKAVAHRERGDYSAALAALEKAREIDPYLIKSVVCINILHHWAVVSMKPQPRQRCMRQEPVWRPLPELDLSNALALEPAALFHLFCR
jgi:hypothetical protein